MDGYTIYIVYILYYIWQMLTIYYIYIMIILSARGSWLTGPDGRKLDWIPLFDAADSLPTQLRINKFQDSNWTN